jgi:Tfp pilus assembly protein PilF
MRTFLRRMRRRRSFPALLLAALALFLSGCQTSRDGVYVDVSALARAYRERADRKPDRAQMEQLVKKLPPEQLTDLGVMYEREQRLDRAEWAYQHAIWRDPRYARAYVNLGNVLRQQGKVEEARYRYRQAMTADPNSIEAVNNFADLCAQDGTATDEAIAKLEPLVEQAGHLRPYALDTLGWLYHQKGDDERARQVLLAALRETNAKDSPLRESVRTHLAAVYQALGRAHEAEGGEPEARQVGGG